MIRKPLFDTAEARKYWAGLGVLFFALLVAYMCLWSQSLRRTDGHFTYALDDAYIHLAIAKNLAMHGIWGVTRYGPSSASSSPLWTILLAVVIRVLGPLDQIPFGLNIFSVFAFALVTFRFWVARGVSSVAVCTSILIALAGGPLVVLTFTGMEHCLHCLLVALFGFWVMRQVNWNRGDPNQRERSKWNWVSGFGLAFLMTLCRFESVFLVLAPLFLSLYRRQFATAVGLVVGPALAIGGFAAYSVLQGMPALPNSITLKAGIPHGSLSLVIQGLLVKLASNSLTPMGITLWWLLGTALAFILVVARGGAVGGLEERDPNSQPKHEDSVARNGYRGVERNGSPMIWLWTLCSGTGLQLTFASVGWFYRYEAYLVTSILVVLLMGASSFSRWRPWPQLAVIAGIGAAIFSRAIISFQQTPEGCRDIYSQQIQMSRFVHRYYEHGRLGANDIGAVSFYSDAQLLDLWGLASDDVRRLKQTGKFNTMWIDGLVGSFQPDLVIAYPSWFRGSQQLPSSLKLVGTWTIPPTTTAGSTVVAFYAPVRSVGTLKRNLANFIPSLPPQVKVWLDLPFNS